MKIIEVNLPKYGKCEGCAAWSEDKDSEASERMGWCCRTPLSGASDPNMPWYEGCWMFLDKKVFKA